MTVALGIPWFSDVCSADYSCDVRWLLMLLNLYFGFSGQVRASPYAEKFMAVIVFSVFFIVIVRIPRKSCMEEN